MDLNRNVRKLMAERLSDINRELAQFRQELGTLRAALEVRQTAVTELEAERTQLQELLAQGGGL